LLSCIAGVLSVGPHLAAQQPTDPVPAPLRALYDSLYFAWDRGDYVTSLEQAERLLLAPGGEIFLERVALLTGELYTVREVAPDGQFLRWSADGRYLSFETGTGADARTHILEVSDDALTPVVDFAGWDANLSPDGQSVAYFRIPASAELSRARERERRAVAAGDEEAQRQARRTIAMLESSGSEIAVRTLADGSERVIAADGIEPFGLTYAGDSSLILVGRRETDFDRIDLFLLSADGGVRQLSEGPGNKGRTLLPAGADRIVYTIDEDRVVIQELDGSGGRMLDGTAPTVSLDGSTLAYLAVVHEGEPDLRRGDGLVGADLRASGRALALMVLSLDDDDAPPRELKRTNLPIAELALSPSGTRVAYNTILRDDWEVFVMTTDGSSEEQVTREVQHDLFPRFLSEERLMAMMGEARHRRAYLYDVGIDAPAESAASPLPGDDQRGRTRLFHNNTIRTVAPQYEWVPNPQGTRVAIVADRDGNTLSPERGVYLVELERPVGREELLARIRAQREAEVELRGWGEAAYAGIEDEVRAAVAEVSVSRIYDHAHALARFGSKFITEPGNGLAIEYLANALRTMGYEPELQWFEPRPGVRSANVVATLTGTDQPELIHVVSSHFDSVEGSPGADDNSSGTTALLEAARVLASRPQPQTIRFAFLTGEEAGLLGAREFVRRAVGAGERVVTTLNNDMIGWSGDHRLDNTIRYSNDTIRDLQHNAAILFTDLITYDARYVRSTDAQAFWDEFGDIIGGIGSYPILGNPHYHQRHDQLEVINQRLVAEVSRTTVATVMRLAKGFDLSDR